MASELFDRVGAKIRQIRQDLAWTQQQLADQIGVQKNTVSEIERGREPSLSVLLEIARAFGVSPAALIDPAVLKEVTSVGTGVAVPRKRPSMVREGSSVAPESVLKAALEQTEANLVRLSEISGYAKGVLEMMRAVTAGQERVVASLAPWVRHEEHIYDTDPQILDDAAEDVMRDAERVAQEQSRKAAPKRKKKKAG